MSARHKLASSVTHRALWIAISALVVVSCLIRQHSYVDLPFSRYLMPTTEPSGSVTTPAVLGVNHTYVLTASHDRLREMTKMLTYGGIDFEAHWGPDIHSSNFEKAFHDVYPEGEAAADHVARSNDQDSTGTSQSQRLKRLDKRYIFRSRYVLACLMGHTDIWQKAIASGHERVLILEDDIDLNANIARIMQEAWQRLPDDWDIVLLGCDSRPLQVGAVRAWQGGQEPKEVELFGRIIATWGLFAYVVRDRALPRMLERVTEQMDLPVDDIVLMEMAGSGELVVYAMWPGVATQLPVHSLIQGKMSEKWPIFGYNGMAFSADAWNRTSVTA